MTRHAALAAGAALISCLASPLHAQELFGLNQFDGAYVGVTFDALHGAQTQTPVGVGGLAGARLSVSEAILVGLEVDGGIGVPRTGSNNFQAFYALVQGGVVVMDNAYLFATAGVGQLALSRVSETQLRAGVGVEYAINELIHLRAQVDYVRRDPAGGSDYLQTKTGVVFQFN